MDSLYLKLKDTWNEECYISYLQLTEILKKQKKDDFCGNQMSREKGSTRSRRFTQC